MSAADLVPDYGQAWNEPDPAVRRALLLRVWGDDAVYTDPTATVHGRQELVTHIGGFKERFAGARLEVSTRVDEYGPNFRFGWVIIDQSGARVVEGVDFGRLGSDGRIASITGFFGPLA